MEQCQKSTIFFKNIKFLKNLKINYRSLRKPKRMLLLLISYLYVYSLTSTFFDTRKINNTVNYKPYYNVLNYNYYITSLQK